VEPIKITEEEARDMSAILCSIEALDEHVAMQMIARGHLVAQRVDWWNKVRRSRGMDGKKMTLDIQNRTITEIVTPEEGE